MIDSTHGLGWYTYPVVTFARRHRRKSNGRPAPPRSAAARLAEAERLYRDFAQLTPYPYPKPFARSFVSWSEYEQWRHAQTNRWLR